MSVGSIYPGLGRRTLGQLSRGAVACTLLWLAPACGLLFTESDPTSSSTPRIGVTYYKVTRDASGEVIASGCIAFGDTESSPGFPIFPVPIGEAYTVLLSGGSKSGTIVTEQDREAACAAGPEPDLPIYDDRRCVRSVRATDSLLGADILDASGAVVARSNSSTPTTVHGTSDRYTLISKESGLVRLDLGNAPCDASFVIREFPVVVGASN